MNLGAVIHEESPAAFVRAIFGEFGAVYLCTECGATYAPAGNNTSRIIHPIETGWIFKKASKCRHAGMKFDRPFQSIRLYPSGSGI